MKGYIIEIEIFPHAAVPLHTKYKSIHALDKSQAFILFNFLFIYLYIHCIYFNFFLGFCIITHF